MKWPLFIRKLQPKQIWQQIFFILFFLVTIPLMVLGGVLLQTSQNAMKTSVLNDHKEIAIHATGEIKEHIEGAREGLLIVASILGRLPGEAWQQETTLVELSLNNKAFQRIAVLDKSGMEMATSALGVPLRRRSQEKGFQQARDGQSYLSEVKISSAHLPYLTMAEPIQKSGNVRSILMADLSLRSVWDLVESIQIGDVGMAYLIDHQGRIIAHKNKQLILQNTKLSQTEIIDNILLGRAGSLRTTDEDNEPLLMSYAPIANLGWGLIMAQPESEVFAYKQMMKTQFLAVIILSIIATIFISFFLAQYMSRPLKNMIQGTERIARGDFSFSFKIKEKNEIGKLFFSFNRMAKKLRIAQENERLSIIGKAATAMAHELKNSLQLVDTFVKELPQRYEDKAFIKDFSDTMPKELDFWNASLRNMMTFSKNAEYARGELNVNKIIEDMLLLTKLKARQLNIDICAELETNLPSVKGNEDKLKQVLLNLVTNALEATPSGGEIKITTRTLSREKHKHGDGFIEMTVRNTGEGIDEERAKEMFTPFYSTKSGGLGLGLSICKEIVEYHKGSIRAESIFGKSTTFLIELPIRTKRPVLKSSVVKSNGGKKSVI